MNILTPDDLPQVMELIHQATLQMKAEGIAQWDEIYPSAKTVETDLRDGSLWGLRDEEGLKAIITLNEKQSFFYIYPKWKYIDTPILIVHRLCVHPKWQHKGIAKQLMNFAEQKARSGGYKAIRLDAFTQNLPAMALYEKLNYEKVGLVHARKGKFCCFEKKLDG